MTNQTTSKIESYGPLSIIAGESYESNDLTLKTYNAGKFIVESSNFTSDYTGVGIGTSTPSYLLDVSGTDIVARFSGRVIGGEAVNTNEFVTLGQVESGQTGMPIGTSGQTLRHDGSAWVANSLLYNNGSNIGIGTTSPGNKLEVYNANSMGSWTSPNTGGATFKINEGSSTSTYMDGNSLLMSSSGWIGVDGANSLDLTTNRISRVHIDSSGNVGIGTTSPSQELDLIGDLELEMTTSNDTGVIYKGSNRFIHNFQHPTGGGAVPAGYNTFVGVNAGNFTMGSTATQTYHGSYNSAMGIQALFSNTTGYYNSAMGLNSLYSNTTGSSNSAMGVDSLNYNTTGYYNSAMGLAALRYNTTGNYNSAMGVRSLYYNTTGYYNSAMGYNTLYNVKPTSKAITAFADYGGTVAGTVKATSVAHGLTGTVANIRISGTTNYDGVYTITVIDVDNFYFTDTWVSNDATGWWGKDTEGRYNTALGYAAGDNITTGSNNIIIGYNTDAPLATGDNQLNIGNTIYGDLSTGKVGIGTADPDALLTVGDNTNSSSVAANVLNVYTDKVTGFSSFGELYHIHDYDIASFGRREAGHEVSAIKLLTMSSVGTTEGARIAMLNRDVSGSSTPTLKFLVGSGTGTDVMNLLSSGNVGIGTTSPSESLHVEGGVRLGTTSSQYNVLNTLAQAGAASGSLYWGNDELLTETNLGSFGVSSVTGMTNQITATPTTGNVVLSIPSDFRAPGTVNATNGLYTGTGAGTLRLTSAGALQNITTYSGSGNITSTGGVISMGGTGNNYFAGKVGIGTTSPSHALHISNSTYGNQLLIERPGGNPVIQMTNGTTTVVGLGYSSGDIFVLEPTSFIVKSSGNVGIGTSSPSYKLDVDGTSRFRNTLYMDNNIIDKATFSLGSFQYGTISPLQNDIAYAADTDGYTVTVNPTPSTGANTISNMFNEDSTSRAEWEETTTLPVTVLVEWGYDHHYKKVHSITFPYNRSTSGVKIETYNNSTSSWKTVYDNNSFSGDSITVTDYENYVRKVKYTFYGSYNDPNPSWGGSLMVSRLHMASSHRVAMDNSSYLLSRGGGQIVGTVKFPGSGIWNTFGQVGIGTTSPSYKLDVSGTGIVGRFSGRVIGANAVNTNEFVTKSQLDTVGGTVYWQRTSPNLSPINANDNILPHTSGNLGAAGSRWGTIYGNTGSFGTLEGNSTLTLQPSADGQDAVKIVDKATGTAILSVDTLNGKVGIGGTTSPDTALHIAGQVKIADGTQGSGKILTSDIDGVASWSDLSSIGGVVTSITGTQNQITEDVSTGDVTLSIPTDFRAPGTVNAVNGIYTGAIAGTQRIDDFGNLLNIGTITFAGGDVLLSRTAANVLGLASGDSFNLVSGSLQVGGTQVITSGRLVMAASGSATTPSFSFSADTNTGMYSGGTDILKFATAGADRVTILANGNVGIGMTSPGEALHIRRSVAGGIGPVILLENPASSADPGISAGIVMGRSTTRNARIRSYATGGYATSPAILFEVQPDAGGFEEKMRIDYNGNVGIGTTSPVSLLSVGATSQFQVNTSGDITKIKNLSYTWPTVHTTDGYLKNNGTGGLSWTEINAVQSTRITTDGTQSKGPIAFWSGSSTINSANGVGGMYWDDTQGYLGIGTDTPSAPLDIAGGTGGSLIKNSSGDITIEPAEDLIISQGDVGIGTPNPLAKLHVKGNQILLKNEANADIGFIMDSGSTATYRDVISFRDRGTDIFALEKTATNAFQLYDYVGGGVSRILVEAGSNSGISFRTKGTGDFSFINNTTTRVTIKNDGKVGIGTASPTNILSLGNSSAQKFWIENSASGTVGRALTVAAGGTVSGGTNIGGGNLILQSGLGTGTGASTISFQTGTTLTTGTTLQTMSTKMTILGSGNVGIGTTAPRTKLDIVDTTTLTNFSMGGTDYATGDIMSAVVGTSGFFDLSTNAYFDGADWNRRKSTYDAWIIGMNTNSSNTGEIEFVHWPTTGSFEKPLEITPDYVELGNTSGGYDMRLSTSSYSDTYGYSALKIVPSGSSTSYPNGRIIIDSHPTYGANSGLEMWTSGTVMGRLTASSNATYAVILDARNAAATTSSFIRFRFSTSNTERFRFRGDGYGTSAAGWSSFSPYLSYNYTEEGKTKSDYKLGQVVSLKETDRWSVTQSNTLEPSPYGVVVHPEGFVSVPKELKGKVWDDGEELEKMPNVVPIAHLGEASTMVRILPGEEIKTGDPISITPLTGVGGKATSAGEILGRALEPTSLWNQASCPAVSSIDAINWPEDDGSNPSKPCYKLPDGSIVGKIMVFVNVSWYDPKPGELLEKIENIEVQLEALNSEENLLLGVNSNIEVALNNTYDLGSNENRWKDIYAQGVVRLGSSTDSGGITYDTETKRLKFTNDGQNWMAVGSPKKSVLLSAQYPGSVVSDSTDVKGAMTTNSTGVDNNFMNYYEWVSSKSDLNTNKIKIRYQIPSDFEQWGDGGITFKYATESINKEENKLDIYVYDQSSDVPETMSLNHVSSVAEKWESVEVLGLPLNKCRTPGDVCIFVIEMSSSQDYYTRVGDVEIKYERNL